MSLTPAQFARAAALESRQSRMRRLSCMSYGELYALLTGDPREAAAWVGSAAEWGLPAAQLRLGRMLLDGQGGPPDEPAAFRWFKRAADQGDAEAMNMLGRCHENGWGVPADLQRAAASYRSSADAGHDWGQYNLGNLLFDGRGVTRDQRQALCWYLRAAHQQHARAMNLVGRCLEQGWGCTCSHDDAAYWYRRSAEAGYFRGQFNHALVLAQQGLGAQAAAWLWKAASGGNIDIQRRIVATLSGASDPVLVEVVARVQQMTSTHSPAQAPGLDGR